MKTQIKVGLAVTGALAAFSFFMSVYLVSGLLSKPSQDVAAGRELRHFSMYLPQNRNYYFSDIMSGAMRAASESGAVISVHTLDSSGTALRMAAYSGLDGIVVCPDLDDTVVFDTLQFLTRKKLPLVLVNHNIPAEQPWPFVGTNNFDFGRKAAQLSLATKREDVNLAVVYSEKSPAIFAERELVEMGINSVLSARLSGPIQGYRTDMNPRDAEKIVYQIVRGRPGINTIVFTDLNDTLAGTQALIDLNQVGLVQVVGFGNDPALLDFIRKGIVAGSVVVNPSLMGYQAVKALSELVSSGYTSTSVDTGIDVITPDNLLSWRAPAERRAGERQ